MLNIQQHEESADQKEAGKYVIPKLSQEEREELRKKLGKMDKLPEEDSLLV